MSTAERLAFAAETILRVSADVDAGLLERMDSWSRTGGGWWDPTADAALSPDSVRRDRARLADLVKAVEDAAAELYRIAAVHSDANWCWSCRNAGIVTAVTRQSDGSPYYKHRCRACGAREATTGRMPDVEWVKKMQVRRQERKAS